ncbi:TSUP family transporter [Elstera sp.]|jgi:uncharacterized membrane protein YfcA|uniref:TSUP family transporter n=1 Tax=Elstera sp. TaxID=1916664 RepID=UPI0037BF813A
MLEFLTLDGLAPTVLIALFFLAMLAGFVDSIAGGGGLLVIPVLFAVGLTPAQVFGTSKLGACFGSFSASMTFIRRGEVQVRPMLGIIAATFIGSVLGALTLQVIDAGILRDLIPFLLIAIALYMLFAKNAGAFETHRRLSEIAFALIFGIGLGFYDGFFGPGTGSFWALAYVTLAGYTLRRATGHAKVVNFTSNVAAFIVLAAGGHVLWGLGVILAAGQFIGARFGAKLVLSKGAKLVRPMLVVMSLAITARLLAQDPEHPLSRLVLSIWQSVGGSV